MPTYPTYPTFEEPTSDLWDFLFEREDRDYPDSKVIYLDCDTRHSYTYAEVKSTAENFGRGLKTRLSWRKGDVLALYTPNSIDVPIVIWGCHWAGGVVSPANPNYTVEELAFQLRDSSAKALVTQLDHLERARHAARQVGLPEDRILLLGVEEDPRTVYRHYKSIEHDAGLTESARPRLDPGVDLAFIVYSSGTTGRPKGVMLTHRNIASNILQIKAGEGDNLSWIGGPTGDGDRILAFLPFFHIYGLTCLIHQSLYTGFTLVVMSKFDIERFCRAVQAFRVTFAYVVPPVVLLLSKHPVVSGYDLTSLRMMNSGAAPLTRNLVDALYQRLKVPVKQGYGLSEMSPTTHSQPWSDWRRNLGSVGRLLPNQCAKYMSPEGDELPAGETGELWIKGPNVFKGYLGNPIETAHAVSPDGYFKTGDVGYQDAEGNFFITDRVKELIKYKGFQVAPAELEGLLLSHPMIADVAVIGRSDRSRETEVPRAYIVLASNDDCRSHARKDVELESEIVTWLSQRVAPHKRLRGGVKFVSEIPKSASGKILRRVIRDSMEKEDELDHRPTSLKLEVKPKM